MTQKTESDTGNRFCKACGTPAEDKLCNHCGAVLDLGAGLIEDQGAGVRRDFEDHTPQQE
ncbi:zinc ribbon domain-containing protein [Streptomyces bungoensis]|uniref:double zinc ribbon domain-containing protein n=1 Tax=Streptomyces bungoensis TaxID=285568 RepID=UPI0036968B6A